MDNINKKYNGEMRQMEPGVVYTIKLRNENYSKKRHSRISLNTLLRITSLLMIIGCIVLIGACIISERKFNKLSSDLENLISEHEEINNASNTIVNSNSIINSALSNYYEFQKVNTTIENDSIPAVGTDSDFIEDTTVSEEIIEDAVEPEEEVKKSILPEKFDFIPLDVELKEYIYISAVNANIPAEILFSIAWRESTFNPEAKSGTNDHGLFQINECNFDTLSKEYGYTYDEFCEKIYDPYVNTDCSIYILTECRDDYNNSNWHHVLMRYNMGPRRTDELFKEGTWSSKYSRSIIAYAAETFNFTDIELD